MILLGFSWCAPCRKHYRSCRSLRPVAMVRQETGEYDWFCNTELSNETATADIDLANIRCLRIRCCWYHHDGTVPLSRAAAVLRRRSPPMGSAPREGPGNASPQVTSRTPFQAPIKTADNTQAVAVCAQASRAPVANWGNHPNRTLTRHGCRQTAVQQPKKAGHPHRGGPAFLLSTVPPTWHPGNATNLRWARGELNPHPVSRTRT